MPERVVVIGSGNVAYAMCGWIREAGHSLVQVFARNIAAGEEIASIYGCGFTDDPSRLARAEIYMVAVSDGAIASVSDRLDFGNSIVVHTCGSRSAGELSPRSGRRGVLYPLQTFSKARSLCFNEIPLFVEADDNALYSEIERFAYTLSERVVRSDAQSRTVVHTAAVFSCNFVNYLYSVADDIMSETGIDFSLLAPLIMETARKAAQSGRPPRELQTGPAARGDMMTIEKHKEILSKNPQWLDIYERLSRGIMSKNSKNG